MKSKFGFDALLDQTFFGSDILSMLGDIEDFIEFSESNIAWQKQRELKKANREFDEKDFEDPNYAGQYKLQMLDSVEYRFEISLKQRVRYASMVALMTTFEWCMLSLKKRSSIAIAKKPRGENETVHLLEQFSRISGVNLDDQIREVAVLFMIRNCIVHAAGLIASYKHENELRADIIGMSGLRLSDRNFLGESILVDEGFIDQVLENAKNWLPGLERCLHSKGALEK